MQINAQPEAATGDERTQNLDPRVDMRENGGELLCRLAGNWTTRRVAVVDKAMRAIPERNGFRSLAVDLSDVGRMDTAGAWLIDRLVSTAGAKGIETRIEGQNEISKILLGAVGDATHKRSSHRAEARPGLLILILAKIGERIYEMRDDFLAAMNILGATIRGGQMKLGRGHSINMAAIFNQIDRMGVGAIPVVVLMSAIVGAIVAQQGAYQLSYF